MLFAIILCTFAQWTTESEFPQQNVLVFPTIDAAANAQFTSTDTTFWIVELQYTGTNCDTDVITQNALATGYCVVKASTSSIMYTCTSVSSCLVNVYSDNSCTTLSNVLPFNLGVCSAKDGDDDGYVTDDGAFVFNQAVVMQGFPSLFSGSSVMQSNYATKTCDSSSMYSYRLGYQNRCYNNYDGSTYSSHKYSDETGHAYSQRGCQADDLFTTVALPANTCQVNGPTHSEKYIVSSGGGGGGGSVSSNTAVIVGAVVGSVGGLLLVALLVYFFVFRAVKTPMSLQQAEMFNQA